MLKYFLDKINLLVIQQNTFLNCLISVKQKKENYYEKIFNDAFILNNGVCMF